MNKAMELKPQFKEFIKVALSITVLGFLVLFGLLASTYVVGYLIDFIQYITANMNNESTIKLHNVILSSFILITLALYFISVYNMKVLKRKL